VDALLFRCNKIKRNHASEQVAFIADFEPNRDFTQQRIIRDVVRLRFIVTGGVIVTCKFDTLQRSQAFPDLHERGAFMSSDPRPAGRIIDDASRGGSERTCHFAGTTLMIKLFLKIFTCHHQPELQDSLAKGRVAYVIESSPRNAARVPAICPRKMPRKSSLSWLKVSQHGLDYFLNRCGEIPSCSNPGIFGDCTLSTCISAT